MFAIILRLSIIRKLWRSFQALINVIWKIITFPFWLFYELEQLFTRANNQQLKLDALKSMISAVSLIAILFAGIGLFINFQDARLDRNLTKEKLIVDRFSRAIDQIGSNKEEFVIKGIYALERIAKDYPRERSTIMEILTAFVRKNSPIPAEIKKLSYQPEEKIKALEKLKPVNDQVKTALKVIGRLNPDPENSQEDIGFLVIDLSESNLSSANFENANLERANFEHANFQHAELGRTNLNSVNLEHANLKDAKLEHANLKRGRLGRVNLHSARLEHAQLDYANLANAQLNIAYLESVILEGATLEFANLTSAILKNANLTSANLFRADLTSANLTSANLTSANLLNVVFHKAILKNVNFLSADLTSANLSGADLTSANLKSSNISSSRLYGVNNLSNIKIKSACFWEKAIFTEWEWNQKEKKYVAIDEQANQEKIEEIRQDKGSDPKKPPDC